MFNHQKSKTMVTLSFETKYFIKKWNKANSSDVRGKLLKNHLTSQYFKKDLIDFLEEFTSQAVGIEKRINLLLLCRKLLLQNPTVIDLEHYRAFRELYDYEKYNASKVEPVNWIESEISFLKEVKCVEEVFNGFNQSNKAIRTDVITLDKYYPQGKELLTLGETLTFLSVSKSTLDRWREDGLQGFKTGKKIYFKRTDLSAWIEKNKPRRITLSLANQKSRQGES
jgi:hypothetical protein